MTLAVEHDVKQKVNLNLLGSNISINKTGQTSLLNHPGGAYTWSRILQQYLVKVTLDPS